MATRRVYYRGVNKGDPRRIRTGSDSWDDALFMTNSAEGARWYGKNISKITLKPDAKILVEGTRPFSRLASKWKKRQDMSMLDFCTNVALAARDAGYDGIHFQRQVDVGTAVWNLDCIDSIVEVS